MTDDAVSFCFAPAPDSAAGARDFVQRTLAGWDYPPRVIDQARLLTSELVTNAIRHTATDSRVTVTCDGHRVRIEVEDGGHGVAVLQPPSPDAPGGRGLQIVDSVAARWGDRPPSPDGYSVWFELLAGTDTGRR
jgi:anti-sigma regulatory factor (Ser/Thr protein kinase)